MSDTSPAFQFYPGDFLSDKNTALMTPEEIGAYVLLMCYCWKEGSLNDDMEEMALLSRMDKEAFKSSWEKRISSCFIMNDHGEWVHPRLEKERQKQQKYRQKKAEAGRKGAQSRWKNDDQSPQMAKDSSGMAVPKEENSSATSSPMAKNGPSSSTSSSTSDSNTYTGQFEDFWDLYDVKKGKKKAFMEWKKLTESEKAKIMENVPIFLTHFSSKHYTPRPRKYLYNRYWEDEDYQQPKTETNNGASKQQSGENRTERFIRRGQEVLGEFPDEDA